MANLKSLYGSAAKDLFIELFSETFGAEKAGLLYSQYPFYDIYQNARFADFLCESGHKTLGIVEVDSSVFKKLTPQDIAKILSTCDKKLNEYYRR